MRAEKTPHQKRNSRSHSKLKKRALLFAALVCFALVPATLLPWNASIPNRSGYYTLCSYAPTSSVALLAAGFTFLSYRNQFRKMLLISVIFLTAILGYTGYYVIALKIPIASLQVSLVVYRIHSFGHVDADDFQHNITEIYFNLTIHNPTNEQTPPFQMDVSSISVNGKELVPDTFHPGDIVAYGHYFYGHEPLVLKPNETYTYSTEIFNPIELELQTTRVWGGNFTSMWPAISQGNANLTFSDLLVSRIPGFSGDQLFLESNELEVIRPDEPMGLDFVFLPLNLAVTSFSASDPSNSE